MPATESSRWETPWQEGSWGAGLVHLLPEDTEAIEAVIEYPLAPLLAAVGVCLLLLIDRVLLETARPGGTRRGEETPHPIYSPVLIVDLSIHSVIAGNALGLEAELAGSLLVMTAILCHKGFAALALIVSVIASGEPVPATCGGRWRFLPGIISLSHEVPGSPLPPVISGISISLSGFGGPLRG